MKRSGWRKQSMQEVIKKQAIKRAKKLTEHQSGFDKVKEHHDKSFEKAFSKTGKEVLDEMKRAIRTPLKPSFLTSKRLVRKEATKGRNKVKSLAKWKKEADAIFSKYIRQRDQGQCFTCPKKDDPKTMQNGHFVPRQYLAVRYDEINCNCQCYACNMLYGGQGATYAIRLAQKYGQETVEKLESMRWVSVKLDETYYRDLIEKYKQLL